MLKLEFELVLELAKYIEPNNIDHYNPYFKMFMDLLPLLCTTKCTNV